MSYVRTTIGLLLLTPLLILFAIALIVGIITLALMQLIGLVFG